MEMKGSMGRGLAEGMREEGGREGTRKRRENVRKEGEKIEIAWGE